MNVLWPIAFITFKEGIRNRAIYGISFFAFLLLGANLFMSGMMMRSAGKASIDMALSTVSLSGLLLVLFVGINLIAKDLDKRTIYMVLARPISRAQYILGKFLGLGLLIITAVLFLSVVGGFSVFLVNLSYPEYFDRVSFSLTAIAVFFTTLMLLLLSALSFLFASFSSTSFITLSLTIIAYIIGQSLNDVKALVDAPKAFEISISPVMSALVKGAYYLLPNLSFFDIKLQAAHGLAVSPSYIGWVTVYGVVYTTIVISLAAIIFRKKEFP